ncbi:MAG: T9SS type A sorting domain-containing protein [Flavobacteriales bacterium]|nr:T9SS type A sorting domain-containing protein [Flavobacteriales bacterium]
MLLLLAFVPWHAHAQLWVQLPDFPGLPRDDAASFALGDRVYVGTGLQVGWVLANDWYVYDTELWTWFPMAALPASPRQYCCTFTIGNTGYLFGGLDASGPLNELWAYDPATDTWTQKASLPAAGRYACASFSDATHGFVATGMRADNLPTNELWRYDPATDSWTQRASLPGPARHRAASAPNGHVIGGADDTFTALTDCWWYQPASDSWSQLYADLPGPRYGAKGVNMLGGTLFVAGGALDQTTFYDTSLLGSSTTLLWTYSTPCPAGTRRGAVLDRTPSSAINAYFGLGLDGSLTRHNDWWLVTSGTGLADLSPDQFRLHPNPGTDHFQIPLSPAMNGWWIEVSDMQGRSVLLDGAHADSRVDATNWAPGTYMITMIDASGNRSHARWVKH